MERRVLVAVALSFVVLFVYQMLFVKSPPRRTAPATPARTTQPAVVAPSATPQATPSPAPSPALEPAAAVTADTAARDVVVETDLVRAVFSNRGAVLTSWVLKRYPGSDGKPLDLVPPRLATLPFQLSVPDAAQTARLREALYRPSADGVHVARGPAVIAFDYQDASGLRARKEFRIEPEGRPYLIDFRAELVPADRTPVTIAWGPALGPPKPPAGMYVRGPAAVFFRDGKVTRVASDDLTATVAHEGRFRYAGVDDQYFLVAALPGERDARIEYATAQAPTPQGHTAAPAAFVTFSVRVSSSPADLRVFAGPKDFDILAAIDRDMVRAIDYGIFAWLVVPLLRSLKFVNAYVGNYGWSIIILTIVINALMFPLRHKSVVSMRKMQELQPEVKAIQDRYAKLKTTDPARQKMNVELMNLYRERGVNPASGCIPMLLTMPVLFAFYSLLSQSIEIRGAPFVGWIRDLAAHDPWYVTPVLMGGTMVWQQKLTPTTADPAQQKIMMLMPIVFTGMFLWAPSGLVLYWLVSNLWAIGQQYATNRIIGPPTVRTVRPPAERRLKRAGSGKTDQAS
jgi:YidC/Oxa1 family membrane protein insertase